MAATHGDAASSRDETSPLIPRRNEVNEPAQCYGAGTFSDATISTTIATGVVSPTANDGHEEDGGGVVSGQGEGQDSRQKQYAGMPEVRKQMKYILPAVAIGVSVLFIYLIENYLSER